MRNPEKEQGSGQMPKKSFGRRLWYLWQPLVLNWGIGLLVSVGTAVIAYKKYFSNHSPKEFMAAAMDMDAAMELAERVTEGVMKHTTEILGVGALITIPIMLFLYYRDLKKRKIYQMPQNKKAPMSKYVLVVLFAGALSMVVNSLILIGNLGNYSTGYQEVSESLYSASMGVMLVCSGFLVPVAEELVFRGLVYRRMREDTPVLPAMIGTALVFGAFHGNMVQMLYGVIMGMALAYLCEKYGSVLAPILGHITANVISILATFGNLYEKVLTNIVTASVVTVGCAVIAALAYQAIRKIDERPVKLEADLMENSVKQ